jgi:hypothetical protein
MTDQPRNTVDRIEGVAGRGTRGLMPFAILAVGSLTLVVACVWLFPALLVAADSGHADLAPDQLAKARNDARATLLQGVGGVVLLVGAYLTWWQTQATRRAGREELALARQGQLTERFTRAVDQLGSPDPAVRTGGIYALERIAIESDRDRSAVTDIVTAFVRRNSASELARGDTGSTSIEALPMWLFLEPRGGQPSRQHRRRPSGVPPGRVNRPEEAPVPRRPPA